VGTRHLAASAALVLVACGARVPALPPAVSLQVGVGDEEPRVLWVAPGPDAWDGPVVGQAVPGFESAFRGRLGRVVGAARLARWVQGGAQSASARGGPVLAHDAPWVLRLRVDGWGLRTGDHAVESFLDLDLSLADETGRTVWQAELACVEPLLPAPVPGAAQVARAVVGLENEDLLARYSMLATECGERAWALAADAPGRRTPGKIGSPGR